MPDANRPIFSIGAVGRMVALPTATIRTWETRYRLVVPARSPGGQRLYTRAQVEQLRFVKREVERGRRPGEAHRLLAERTAAPPGDGEAEALLRRLFEEGGYVVVGADALAAPPRAKDGLRVLAVVPPWAEEPPADAILRLPLPPADGPGDRIGS